jgi:hypothetical protein
MRITDLFIRRPVLALVVNLVILLAGFQSVHVLNVRQYPRSDIAVIQVTTAYVGANADLVRGYITTPLERVIAAAEGIDGTVAVQARQSLEESRWLLELAAADPLVRGVVGWVDLRSTHVEDQLRAFADRPKFVGVRHVVQDHTHLRNRLLPLSALLADLLLVF